MLEVVGPHRVNRRGALGAGATYDVEWVSIANADPETGTGVRDQGLALGTAEFARAGGCWLGNGLV